MDGDAVREVADLAQEAIGAPTVAIDGVEYSRIPLHDVRKKEPEPDPLVVHTLDALVDYLHENQDDLDKGETLIHVASPTAVDVLSALQGRFQQRFAYLKARATATTFPFGGFQELETMVIQMQAQFVDLEDRSDVLKLLGNVTDEVLKTQADDGVSQRVSAKSGINLLEETPVPNPVVLAPYRTFREVEQPASPFVLRLKKGMGGVQAALFEADGGAWQLQAIERVADYLGSRTDFSIIA